MLLVHIHSLILSKFQGWDYRSYYFSCLCFPFSVQLAYVAFVPRKEHNNFKSKKSEPPNPLCVLVIYLFPISFKTVVFQSIATSLLFSLVQIPCGYMVDLQLLVFSSTYLLFSSWFSRCVSCGQPWKNNEPAHQHCHKVKQEIRLHWEKGPFIASISRISAFLDREKLGENWNCICYLCVRIDKENLSAHLLLPSAVQFVLSFYTFALLI